MVYFSILGNNQLGLPQVTKQDFFNSRALTVHYCFDVSLLRFVSTLIHSQRGVCIFVHPPAIYKKEMRPLTISEDRKKAFTRLFLHFIFLLGLFCSSFAKKKPNFPSHFPSTICSTNTVLLVLVLKIEHSVFGRFSSSSLNC